MSTIETIRTYTLGRSVVKHQTFPRIQNGSRLCATMSQKKKTCNSETFVRNNEDVSVAVTRFEKDFRISNVFHEARRRQRFENKQDLLKRKMREKGFKKIQARFPVETYASTQVRGLVSVPFQDLYAEENEEDDYLFGEGGFFSSKDSQDESYSSSLDIPISSTKSQ